MDSESKHLLSSLLGQLLREAFAGPPGPWSYFTDNRRGVGLLFTLESISAEEASLPSGPGGSTIAGQVNHVQSSLAASIGLMKKENSVRDRTGTWTVTRVSDSEWSSLQRQLREQYERSLQTIQTRTDWDEDSLGAALGAVTHVAYHLGSVRQRLLTAGILRT
jgi:hypothetical protein